MQTTDSVNNLALTWAELSALPVGARVSFVEPWDIWPIVLVQAGTAATLASNYLNELSGIATVLPDDAAMREALAAWDGEIQLWPEPRDDGWHDRSPVALCLTPVNSISRKENRCLTYQRSRPASSMA